MIRSGVDNFDFRFLSAVFDQSNAIDRFDIWNDDFRLLALKRSSVACDPKDKHDIIDIRRDAHDIRSEAYFWEESDLFDVLYFSCESNFSRVWEDRNGFDFTVSTK